MKNLRKYSRAALGTILLLWLVASCTTVPETGRRQLNLLSPGQEMQLGLTAFEQIKNETPISKDPQANALVQKVGKRIASVADLPNAQWEFVVFENPEPNAFALPGGKVGINTGILPITRDEAGLATVIGHEVAHATLRHGSERLSEAMAIQGVGQLLGLGLSSADPRWQAGLMLAYGVGTKLGRELPHSRDQESEADRVGLRYMARAGYDPAAAVAFWQRFAEANRRSGSSTPEFLRTHPLDETRIRQIQEWLPEAQQEFRPQR